MDGHQSTAFIQSQLRGEPMDLDDPPRERVGHRVLVAVDADHPIARQAPLQAQHGRVRVRRQRLQLPTFLREGFLDHPPRRAVLTAGEGQDRTRGGLPEALVPGGTQLLAGWPI